MPPVFHWLAKVGGIKPVEMLRVFNCGVGMAVVVADADAAIRVLEAEGETVTQIGVIEAALGAASVRIDPPADWLA